jgi:hypothetical protein
MFATDSWYSCAAHAQLRGESLPPMVIADGRWSCGKKLIGQGNLTGFPLETLVGWCPVRWKESGHASEEFLRQQTPRYVSWPGSYWHCK